MSMEIAAIILIASVLHAGWNALIKISGDRVAIMAVMTLAGTFISLVALPFVENPSPESWPLLAVTILLHTGYSFFLAIAYEHGDLGQVYPIARGSAPILVTIGAIIFADEYLELPAMIGVICLAVGVMTLTFDKTDGMRSNPKAVFYALATGLCISAYTVVDGLGARKAESVLGFAVWLTIGDGLLIFLIALAWKKSAVWRVARANPGRGVTGGAMQVLAYWIIVWALASAPMGMVSGLRETSVLFAALISTFILKEGFGVWRFVSAGLITFGIILGRHQR